MGSLTTSNKYGIIHVRRYNSWSNAPLAEGRDYMKDPIAKRGSVTLIIRWIARVWSIASIGFTLLIFIGELIYPHARRQLRSVTGLDYSSSPSGCAWG